MKKIQIEKIAIRDNIRKDYGDLTELSASIKMYGLRNPVELDTNNVLIDGYRRIKAAKVAGITEVPYFVNDDDLSKTESQLISGIFQKNLNPIEEGKAFRDYIIAKKIKVEEFAKKISKQVSYIEKRIVLANLPEEVQKALINNKIRIGHALLLARFTKQDSKKFLRKIIQDKASVEEAKESLEYSSLTARLSEVKFDKSECKNCQFNGAKQTELFETGKILNGKCMNPKCFYKKVKQFVKEKREKFKDILYEPENDYSNPNGYVDGSYEWDCENKGVTKKYKEKCKKERDYLVQVKDDGKIIEYFRIPPKKKAKEGTKQAEKEQDVSEEKREQVLTSKVNEFKTEFLIKKSIELMQPGTKQVKALNVLRLIQNASWQEIEEMPKELEKLIQRGYACGANVKNIFEASESDLDKAIVLLSKMALRRVDLKELIEISRNFKVDVNKHFNITEDYLKLYTKDQLMDLITEFKLFVNSDDPKVKTISSGNIKKGDLIQHILNQKLKGKIPKIMC